MYRHPSYSEDQDWENLNQSQRGNSNIQQYHHYGNSGQRNSQNQNYDRFQSQGQNREDRYQRNQNERRSHNQNREDNFGSGYGLRPENKRNQDYNYDYNQPQRNRNQHEDLRGSYRLDNERNESGYRQLNDRNFGPDYGYGHAGSSRTGGDYGRNQSDYGTGGTYGASRNAGSMGSYGGAQGYGSSSNGYSPNKWGSGHHGLQKEVHHTVYGAYRDKNSFAPGERESYDGSQRSGSQGADNTRGWKTPGRSGKAGSYQHYSSDEDSRYEIYDSALGQYNRGDYSHNTGNSITYEPNQHTHQNQPPQRAYGSRQRGLNRQGTGSDQDRYLGGDMDYQNTAGSLSVGYDGYRGQAGPQNRYFDPMTGDVRNPGSERSI